MTWPIPQHPPVTEAAGKMIEVPSGRGTKEMNQGDGDEARDDGASHFCEPRHNHGYHPHDDEKR